MRDGDDLVKEGLFVPGLCVGAFIMFAFMAFFMKFSLTADGYIERSLPIKISNKTYICKEQAVTYQDIVNDPLKSAAK